MRYYIFGVSYYRNKVMGKVVSSSEEEKLKEYLAFQIHRDIVAVYKQHLVLLQDIVIEHHDMMRKLENQEIRKLRISVFPGKTQKSKIRKLGN